MHKVIRAVVYADNETEALEKSKKIFASLCDEDGGCFDYYQTFDEDGSEVSGKGRWGELPPVSKASSKEGKALINEGIKYTKDSFLENVEHIKKALEKFTKEDLFEEVILDNKNRVVNRLGGGKDNNYMLSMFKYYCSCVGQYKGSEVWLYDNDGEGIRNNRHLKDVLTEWNEGKEVWVVPSDVHF